MDHEQYKVSIPEAQMGGFKIVHFEVTEEAARMFNLRQVMNRHRGLPRLVVPGMYTKLVQNNETIMSDTPAEIRDHMWIINRAEQKVLITGLGIGMVAKACLKNPKVDHVTVIEISPEVIQLVGTHLLKEFPDKLTIINADAYEWKPVDTSRGIKHFFYGWHDIWPSICSENWEGMKKLRRRYSKWLTFQRCWCDNQVEILVENARRAEKRYKQFMEG